MSTSSSLENARATLAEQLTSLHAHTPSYITKLTAELQPGPAEWLFHSLGGCACGSCGDGEVRAGIDSNLMSDGRVGSYSVECLVRGPSADPCYGKSSYRLRITVGAHTAGFGDSSQDAVRREDEDDDEAVARPWPVLRFLDEVHHLGVEYSDGVVKQDLLDVLTDDWAEAKKSSPTLEALLGLVHTQVLVGLAPAALLDDSQVNNGSRSRNDGRWALSPVQHQWQQHANANRQRVEAVAEFRDGLAPCPALLDPAAAPTCLADFGLSDHWPDGIIDAGTLEALNALIHGDGGAALFGNKGGGKSGKSGNKGDCGAGNDKSGVARWECVGVASLPLFTPAFCAHVIATLEAYEASGLPTVRPNSMNNYGAVLSRLGFTPLLQSLQELVAAPLASALDERHWGDEAATAAAAVQPSPVALPVPSEEASSANLPGAPPAPNGKNDDAHVEMAAGLKPVNEASWLDGQHVFSVRYKAEEDLSLDLHTDDSEVTLNACLGKPGFEGSGLVFCGTLGAADHRVMKIRYRHELGRCVVHRGSQRHGADEITGGERVNLVMWHRSLAFRRRKERTACSYDAEGALPSVECLSFTHDRDYLVHQPPGTVLSPAASLAAGRGWCPPPGKEFRPPSPADSNQQPHEEKASPTA